MRSLTCSDPSRAKSFRNCCSFLLCSFSRFCIRQHHLLRLIYDVQYFQILCVCEHTAGLYHVVIDLCMIARIRSHRDGSWGCTNDYLKIKLATTVYRHFKNPRRKEKTHAAHPVREPTALSTSSAIVTHPRGKVALFLWRRDHIMAVILICPARVLARWSRRDVFDIGKTEATSGYTRELQPSGKKWQ